MHTVPVGIKYLLTYEMNNQHKYCGRIDIMYDCGHATTIEYIGCHKHENASQDVMENCHTSQPKDLKPNVTVRQGMDMCFYPCRVAYSGWLCCECGHKKVKGWVDRTMYRPTHEVTSMNGDVSTHMYCNKCRIIDTLMDSVEDLVICSGRNSTALTLEGKHRSARVDSFMDTDPCADEYMSVMRLLDNDGGSNGIICTNKNKHGNTSPDVDMNVSDCLYERLMKGEELVLDVKTLVGKNVLRRLASDPRMR
jgi:hypothetical protein